MIVTDTFLNASYMVLPPCPEHYDVFSEEEMMYWDPNHHSIFEHERDGAWLKSTWEDYICPKYKKALDRWNKETGGGDGTPPFFIDYCGGDRWLVWLFCKDYETNFLLTSNTGGRMANHLQFEAGFTNEDMSSLGASDSTPSTAKRAAIEEELQESKHQRKQIEDMMEKVVTYLDSKRNIDCHTPGRMDGYIRKVVDYFQIIKDDSVLDTMFPNSREVYVKALQKERKDNVILKRMSGDTDSSGEKEKDSSD